jgi:hypothetical protein
MDWGALNPLGGIIPVTSAVFFSFYQKNAKNNGYHHAHSHTQHACHTVRQCTDTQMSKGCGEHARKQTCWRCHVVGIVLLRVRRSRRSFGCRSRRRCRGRRLHHMQILDISTPTKAAAEPHQSKVMLACIALAGENAHS